MISPKGPKGKDGDSASDAAPISFTGGSGDRTESGASGGLDGPIIGNRPSDREGGEGSGSRPPPPVGVAPVTASSFANPIEEKYRQIGEAAQQDLKVAIATNRADNNKGSIEANGYVRGDDLEQKARNAGPLQTDFKDNGRYLEVFGIKASSADKTGWVNKIIRNNANSDAISTYSVSVKEKTIILKDSRNEDNDDNRKPGATQPENAMKLRDMAMDSWRTAAGNSDTVKDLKWIVRNDVVTAESQVAIEAAFAKAGIDTKLKAVFKPDATDPNGLAAYQEIAGSIHGQGIVKMLSDHHVELGNLEVVAFHVYAKGNKQRVIDNSAGKIPGYYAIVAELGRR